MRAACWAATCLFASAAHAEQLIPLDGVIARAGLDHERVAFDVPAGIAEIQIDHDDDSAADILDWGLEDPDGFRGWGGGNGEPAIVSDRAASRSYLPGPLTPGRWHVVIGKAKITGDSVSYRLSVTLREASTLAPQPERTDYQPSAPLLVERRWYAGDLHAHSRESGDASPTLDAMASFAAAQGLDFIELSDHNTRSQIDFIVDAQARHPRVLLLPGVEWTSYGGHANGIGATRWVDHKIGQPGVTVEAAAASFHAQGALLSINHPKFDLGELCIGCAWAHALSPQEVDAVEIATAGAGTLFIAESLAFWDEICASGRHAAAVGGSDDHSAGERLGPFGTPLGTPATYVLADALSADAIVAGIRSGRTVVKLLGPSDPMVELDATPALDGDTIRANAATLTARITGGQGLSARWVVDGTPDRALQISGDPFELERAVTAPPSGQTRYRVEVLRSELPTTITSHLWIERDPDDSDGCGCATTHDRRGAYPALLASAFAVGLMRRRRSRRTAER